MFIVLSVTISLIAGGLPWNYFAERASIIPGFGGWAIFVLSAIIFFLMGNQLHDLRYLKLMAFIFLLLGTTAVINRALPSFSPIAATAVTRGADGSLLWVWIVAIAGGQALFDESLDPPPGGSV